MPGSRVPSVEKILQEVYGDIEEYSRSKKGNMDRSKRSTSRRRTDSRYRSVRRNQSTIYYVVSKDLFGKFISSQEAVELQNESHITAVNMSYGMGVLLVRSRCGGPAPARSTCM